MVDSWEVWTDFHALALRPFGWREVWIGYDPAKGTQTATAPDAWWWHRQPCRVVSSAFLKVTSGAGWTSAPG